MIYIIRENEIGRRRFNIGVTYNFETTFAEIQANSPSLLQRLALVPGGFKTFNSLMKFFEPYHIRGSWFLDTHEMKVLINNIINIHSGEMSLPELRTSDLTPEQQLNNEVPTHSENDVIRRRKKLVDIQKPIPINQVTTDIKNCIKQVRRDFDFFYISKLKQVMLPSAIKIPVSRHTNVSYIYFYYYKQRLIYIGKTNRHLPIRIKGHFGGITKFDLYITSLNKTELEKVHIFYYEIVGDKNKIYEMLELLESRIIAQLNPTHNIIYNMNNTIPV